MWEDEGIEEEERNRMFEEEMRRKIKKAIKKINIVKLLVGRQSTSQTNKVIIFWNQVV